MSLDLSWARPASSCSTSPSTATTGTSTRASLQGGEHLGVRRRVGRPRRERLDAARSGRCRRRRRTPGRGSAALRRASVTGPFSRRLATRGRIQATCGTLDDVDDAAWAALTLSLTVLGGIWTWVSFQRRGAASGLRALGFTLLPLAAYLTKTLQMFTRSQTRSTDWATDLVFNPFVWAGIALTGVSVVLFAGLGSDCALASALRSVRPARRSALRTARKRVGRRSRTTTTWPRSRRCCASEESTDDRLPGRPRAGGPQPAVVPAQRRGRQARRPAVHPDLRRRPRRLRRQRGRPASAAPPASRSGWRRSRCASRP